MTDQKRRTWLEKLDIQYARLQADITKIEHAQFKAKMAKNEAEVARLDSRLTKLSTQLKDTKDRLVRGWETAQ